MVKSMEGGQPFAFLTPATFPFAGVFCFSGIRYIARTSTYRSNLASYSKMSCQHVGGNKGTIGVFLFAVREYNPAFQ